MIDRLTKESDAQLQLEMGLETYALLNNMVASLEASSYGEVVRRALKVSEIYWVEDSADLSTSLLPAISDGAIKRLHVRVPQRTKQRLDRFKSLRGGSYSDILTKSLQVLAQLIRNREALIDGDRPMEDGSEELSHLNAALA